jgi:hypothetical protein
VFLRRVQRAPQIAYIPLSMPNSRILLGITCSVCERSLLLGEEPIRFSPDGGELVDVCPLCQQTALDHGWIREGGPSLPTYQADRRRRGWLGSFLRPRARPAETIAEPLLRRLPKPDQVVVEAAAIFNESVFRRTVDGIARSLGPPRVSLVALSGLNTEVVVTIVWEISWYQYRVSFDAAQPVRLAEKGLDPEELDESFLNWNAELTEDGRIVPHIARSES